MRRQKTIRKPVTVQGRGLFSGVACKLRFVPAPANDGIVFLRNDLPGPAQIATDVASFNYARQLGGLVFVWATAQPGGDLLAVEKALEEEIERLADGGPTEAELKRSKTSQRAGFIRGIERVGGFGGKSDILAASAVYLGSPDAHKETQARISSASREQVHAAAKKWLDEGAFTLEVRPFAEYSVAETGVDRKQGVPKVSEFPSGRFPKRERATLSNGMKLILAHRDAVPVVELNLLLDAGYAADQFGLPGTASLALGMLDEGTASRTALQISDELDRLGELENTVVVFTSDHGEAFGEHGSWTHGLDLFNEVLSIPLVMRLPNGAGAGQRVSTMVQHIDLLPTILGLCGIDCPVDRPGAVLLDASGTVRVGNYRTIFAYLDYWGKTGATALRDGWKLIQPLSVDFGPEIELYRHNQDRVEANDLASRSPVRSGWLLAQLAVALRGEGTSLTIDVDAETRAQLEALGYMH